MTNWRLDPGQIEVVDEAVARVLRRMTPAQRLERMFDCNRTMRLMLEASIGARHPDWTRKQVMSEVARRISRATGRTVSPDNRSP